MMFFQFFFVSTLRVLGREIETGENPDGPLIIARNVIRCIKSKVAPRRPDFSA